MSTTNQFISEKLLPQTRSPIQDCIQEELTTYFRLLDGQSPNNLYRLVMRQVETTLLSTVLEECNGNQSKAANYLGMSRGTLRSKVSQIERADAASQPN